MKRLVLFIFSILAMLNIGTTDQVMAQSKIEGIWQLTIPARNDDRTDIGYLPYWKVYSSDGTYKVFFWKSAQEGAIITSDGSYALEGDTVIVETVGYSTSLKRGTVNRIGIELIGDGLMNTHHHVTESNEKWQELWQKVTENPGTANKPYIKAPASNSMPQRDLNGVYFYTDQKPSYPGGEKALQQHIAESINYPTDALKNGMDGTTIIRFIINEKGKPESLQIIRSSFPPLDSEAARVIRTLTFKPATNHGKKVKVYYTIPVNFKIK